jgi:ribosome biogenesis protein BMS1
MAVKGHRKKKAGRKADKKKKAAGKSSTGEAGIDAGIKDAGPKPTALASKGKARVQRARTAEKEQRRLHGAALHIRSAPTPLSV